MDDELTNMLINYSSTAMGQIGDSYSLEISMASRSLSMRYALNLKMHLMTVTFITATHSISSQPTAQFTLVLNMLLAQLNNSILPHPT